MPHQSFRVTTNHGCLYFVLRIPGGRSILPFFVSEKVCSRRDLRGVDQLESCHVDYEALLENGGECKLWPTTKVDLSSVEPAFQRHILNLKWYSCLPQTLQTKYAFLLVSLFGGLEIDMEKGKKRLKRFAVAAVSHLGKVMIMRHAYFSRPNPITFKCEKTVRSSLFFFKITIFSLEPLKHRDFRMDGLFENSSPNTALNSPIEHSFFNVYFEDNKFHTTRLLLSMINTRSKNSSS